MFGFLLPCLVLVLVVYILYICHDVNFPSFECARVMTILHIKPVWFPFRLGPSSTTASTGGGLNERMIERKRDRDTSCIRTLCNPRHIIYS